MILTKLVSLLAVAATAVATTPEGEPYLRRLMSDHRLIMIVK